MMKLICIRKQKTRFSMETTRFFWHISVDFGLFFSGSRLNSIRNSKSTDGRAHLHRKLVLRREKRRQIRKRRPPDGSRKIQLGRRKQKKRKKETTRVLFCCCCCCCSCYYYFSGFSVPFFLVSEQVLRRRDGVAFNQLDDEALSISDIFLWQFPLKKKLN